MSYQAALAADLANHSLSFLIGAALIFLISLIISKKRVAEAVTALSAQKDVQFKETIHSLMKSQDFSWVRKKVLLKKAGVELSGESHEASAALAEDYLLRASALHEVEDEQDLDTIAGYYSDEVSALHNRYIAYFWQYASFKFATTPSLKDKFHKDLEKSAAQLEAKYMNWITSQVDTHHPKSATIVLPKKIISYTKGNGIK